MLRDERTDNAGFRALRELTLLSIYEATRDALLRAVPIRYAAGRDGRVAANQATPLVPGVAAGLDARRGACRLPEAHVGFVGRPRRVKPTTVPYLDSLPDDSDGCTGQRCLTRMVGHWRVDDAHPRSADLARCSGYHGVSGLRRQKDRGAAEAGPRQTRLFTAAIDEGLTRSPGLCPVFGDAGDRQFGLRHHHRRTLADSSSILARASCRVGGHRSPRSEFPGQHFQFRFCSSWPHRHPGQHVVVAAGEDQRVADIATVAGETADVVSAELPYQVGSLDGAAHGRDRAATSCMPQHRASFVERVGHRTTRLLSAGHQIAHQHCGADAVFVTHRGGADAVPDRFLAGGTRVPGRFASARQPLKAGEVSTCTAA